MNGILTTERYWKNNYSAFFLTFDKTVTITESRFPRVDVAKLFADLGGTLGLWLGLGVIQIIHFGMDLFSHFRNKK